MTSTNTPERFLLGFAEALRGAGVAVTPDRAQAYLAAVAVIGLADREATAVAGRATLCASPDDLARYDEVFATWFTAGWDWARPGGTPARPRPPGSALSLGEGEDGAGEDTQAAARAMASDTEVLRHRDVAGLDATERARLAALFARLPVRAPMRRTARSEAWRRGRVDGQRTLRASLRRAGEPAPIVWRRRAHRPRRVVLLVDVSGSMSGYAEALLRLAHRIVQGSRRTEVFTLGTRLTHVTAPMRLRDPDRALVAAGATVPDWAGGTRLGETLRAFLARRRDLARGAVVVIFSDGWERGDTALLGEQVAALRRLAHRVVWVNPHRGKAGYEPVQRGIVAVLPHLDDLLAGHTLATYADLVGVIARA
jgi:uncharacterized protein with von Willebrand factor type A (vWA) domain